MLEAFIRFCCILVRGVTLANRRPTEFGKWLRDRASLVPFCVASPAGMFTLCAALAFRRTLGCLLVFAWLATLASGGEAWRPWPFKGDDKPGKPDKVVALWTDTVLNRSNTPPVRGFGGRLMFYEGKKENPVKIDGMLVVYAFDENGPNSDSTRPDRKYVFTPEQVPAHYSKSKIGHSYSVWIPWDEVGGIQKEITLIVRFEPKNGTPVVGEQHRMLLPGLTPPSRPGDAAALPSVAGIPAAAAGVQRASYEATIPAGNATDQDNSRRPRRMTTSTIPVSRNLASRAGAAATTPPPAGNWQPPTTRSYSPPPGTNRQGYDGTTPGFQPPRTTVPTSSNSTTPPAGFQPGRLRPLGEPLARLARDRAQWQQRLEAPPSAPASQPGSASANGSPANQQAAGSATN
jgi:hypothetical protein